MNSHPSKKTAAINFNMTCNSTSCLLCTIIETHTSVRRKLIAQCFKDLPLLRDDKNLVITLRCLWNIALAQPDDPEFPYLGIFNCMTRLLNRCIRDQKWLSSGKNVYVPYYAAHIIGSYTMNKSRFSVLAVKSAVISPLIELLRGKITWVEQRVAVRALGHIARHRRTFEDIKVYETEIIKLAMDIVSKCIQTIYTEFVIKKSENRVEYHRHLMIKGLGGFEMENRKAESWACQMQCWSLYLLNCFVRKKRSINLICKEEFLKKLCAIWGGLQNQNSFSGIGLIKSLRHSEIGRRNIAQSEEIVASICNISRSSDEWQLWAIESLLLLLKDQNTRSVVRNIAAPFLADLVELRTVKGRRKMGDVITQVILQDYAKIKYGQLSFTRKGSQKAIEEIWELKVEKRKRDKLMSEEEVRERELLVAILKREGNRKFWSADIEEAVNKYTKALDLCPLKLRKERIVLYSNRAQCHLILGEAELAISDTTRALCLSGEMRPHIKSLWRRSQAYDMKGLARLSLMDCLMFINERSKFNNGNRSSKRKIPYCAMCMLNKQITATWIFAGVAKSMEDDINDDGTHKSRDAQHVFAGAKMKGKTEAILKSMRTHGNDKEERLLKKGRLWRRLNSTSRRSKGVIEPLLKRFKGRKSVDVQEKKVK
ncbi:PREDICTED: uncharacterized protein LOC109223337 [Nicotiana attenuata]|uniref:ARM repeat N-terminal plant domain-containing protein n=1 Tax=Nicotiana attenuata TaxID=49451 RepID=A0A1J6J3G6_NICAT|nr:PREDICTED: uncharacterized protein LOC109223337 [Nicotiana attenuata]OIT04431.1 hypothetical protein A4A49_36972 [Nicotiana attenuata]